jgi:asparagine synthase (glutamine-hydrolysing)
MCGIVGIAGHLKREALARVVNAMNNAITHRGPDDEGSWVGEDFAFGMRRLSIIDLSGGHQPMWDSRTGLGIVYNGEVYNYRTIRKDLENRGVRFRTVSDTEVVLQGLALKGQAAVNDWNGMFAVAAWSERDKKLLLIRDRIGVKPLYYYWDGSILMFASEVKSILESGIFVRDLNRQAIWDYLTYRYVPSTDTMWHNVWKLPPGHMLQWSPNQQPRLSQYWETDVVSGHDGVDVEQAVKEFEHLFLNSVEQRLLAADVPVGVMLSGGLDSSAVAAAAVELGHQRFHTFSVGFSEGGEYSELNFARQVANHLGVQEHHVIVDQSNFLEMLPHAVRAADEPLADLTIVPLLAVSRLAREHVKVVLSGEGADEILAGYNFDHFYRNFQTIRRLQRLPASVIKAASNTLRPFFPRYADILARIGRIPLSEWNAAHKTHITHFWSEVDKRMLWSGFIGRDSDQILTDLYAAARSSDPLDQMLSVYQKSWLVEDLLMKADKISMAASLELRVPFLDYRLVEWTNRQPQWVKIGRRRQRYITKYVLRRFAEKRLPREIIDRPKLGFPVPVYRWLRDEKFVRWVMEHLTGQRAKVKNLFERHMIERQVLQAKANEHTEAHKLWTLIVLESWLREFDVEIEPVSRHETAASSTYTLPSLTAPQAAKSPLKTSQP